MNTPATFTSVNRDDSWTLTMHFNVADHLERLHARVSLINHNLAPDPDTGGESLSWEESIDASMATFSLASAADRVTRRLAAWGVSMTVSPESVNIQVPWPSDPGRFARLTASQADAAIFHLTLADKLTLAPQPMREAIRIMRDEHRACGEQALQDMAATMAITHP